MLSAEAKKRFAAVRETHCIVQAVSLENAGYRKNVCDFFNGALRQDASPRGDITTAAVIGNIQANARAGILAKSAGTAAGIEELQFFFGCRDSSLKGKLSFKAMIRDGQSFAPGRLIAELKGAAGDILLAERTILNFLQRMCGIATNTRKIVADVPDRILLTPTRKTFWGILDKKAVLCGGGGTHRINLSDAILVKDNHLKLLGGDIEKLFASLAQAADKGRFIEIEADSTDTALKILRTYDRYRQSGLLNAPLFLMLDNFKPVMIKQVIAAAEKSLIDKNVYFEASGGINASNVKTYAGTGVDIISMGFLTNSAPACDLSLKMTS